MNKFLKSLLVVLLITPLTTFAYFGGLHDIIEAIGGIVKLLTTLMGAIALLIFFWGLMKFIFTTSSSGKADGKKVMVWGIVALFVMISVWGIVAFFQKEFGLPVTATGEIPHSQTVNQQNPDTPCDSFSDDPDVQPCL